ncbi:GrpB family protein [Oceanobacillus timonensis]|uniref:GrpB family protein n=1 Tax=Oceanobacillus timonensis TaxID=1926285 RepID=UPI0015C4458E|nr:GrpB family protein [Oceanobacillus timonensis]
MHLGLKRNEVKLVPHDEEWSAEFVCIQEQIKNVLNVDEETIQHIGSTAIQDISAKPVIDILLGVENIHQVEAKTFKGLQTIGFYRLKVERENEIILAKFTDGTFLEKTHYIHMTDINGVKWRNLLYFRDALNADAPLRREYEHLKQALMTKKGMEIIKYTDEKESFVNKVLSMKK